MGSEENPADKKEWEAKFRQEWGDDLLYKTTKSIVMKPRAYYKRIPGHPMGKREWWVKFVFIIFKLELD